MLNATALRYFLEVHRQGSYRAAAEHLFVAPSAISRQVMLLEEEVGSPLLERSRGKSTLALTAAGEVLVRYARRMELELERTKSDIEALSGMKRGRVLFGIPETFSRDFIPEFLAKFNNQYCGITYHLHVAGTPELLEMLANDDLDAVMAFNASVSPDLRVVYQKKLSSHVLVPEGHPLFEREQLTLSDIAEYGIALPDRHIGSKVAFDQMFRKASIRPRTVLTSNSYELLRSAAMAGLSLAIVNQHIGYPLQNSPSVRYIPLIDKRAETIHFSLCVRAGRILPVSTSTFITHIVEEINQLDAFKNP